MTQEEAADRSDRALAVPRLTLIPHRHVKIIHLVRHGEGWHNVAGRADEAEYKSPDWLDAHLTDLGWRQALALRRHIEGLGTAIQPGVIIVSPLTRALETAAGAFGKPCTEANASAPLFMRAQDAVPQRRAAQGAISAAGLPPLVAIEECREHLGVHPCDKRRSISEAVAPCFPAVDFSQIESDEDTLWLAEHRETKDEIKARGARFMQALMERPEREIAVVSHSGILWAALQNFGDGYLAAPVVGELHRWWENAEMRTVVLAEPDGVHNHQDELHFRGGAHSV